VVVDLIIRTCSFGIALIAFAGASPVTAKTEQRSALSYYVQSRLAQDDAPAQSVAAGYAAAMIAEPANKNIATRAYRESIRAGDMKLALRSALQLESAGALPGDARLLLFGERLNRGDLRGARLLIDKIEQDQNFNFTAPILKAWVALAAREVDPLEALDISAQNGLSMGYVAEQRALMLFAIGKHAEGIAAVNSLAGIGPRFVSLRINAAATLAAAKDRVAAKALLLGNDKASLAAKVVLDSQGSFSHSITTAPQGVAQLYARIAADLLRDRAPVFALTMARFARALDANSEFAALVEAQALQAAGLDAAALVATEHMAALVIYRDEIDQIRLKALEKLDREDDAIALATARARAANAGVNEHVQLGDLLQRLKRDRVAAGAYANAITIAESTGDQDALWVLWFLKGGALERAGEWTEAKLALQKAVNLAPDQPSALNYLGYAMLDRRENIAEATALITRASLLKPDDPAITDSLGWAYFVGGKLELAVETLERAVAAEPIEAALGEHLGDAYWATGRKVDARYAWQAALIQSEGDVAIRLKEKLDVGLLPTQSK
jgi:tetratricopeptide (TPR) repeat protein